MQPHAMTDSDKFQCNLSIRRIKELLETGVFISGLTTPLQMAAFIEVIICLRDLLEKCSKYGRRISFTDDVIVIGEVKDVTDAIKWMRDACCHLHTRQRNFDIEEGSATNCLVVSHGDCSGMKMCGRILGSEYADDMAFCYGLNRIYLRRHVVRAFEEAKCVLAPLLE